MKITELLKALPAMGDSLDARLAEGLLVTSPDMVYIYDLTESRYTYLTGETTATLGYTSEELLAMGNTVQTRLVHPDDAQRLAGHHRECAQAKEGDLLEIEYRIRHAYGDWHWLSARDTPLSNPAEEGVRYILGVAEDISERRAAQEKVWFLSTHDQLTGLFNRAYFEAEIGRMEKGRRFPISILCVDVDKLHAVNDAEGHEAGDELLRRTGQVLMSAFRAEDVVARLGGDEFGVILPNTGSVSTEAILARVKSHLSSHNQSHRGKLLGLSLGIATVDFGQSLNEAVKNAEKKLYDAKLASTG
jgi:diguanylate cyclase (GGDEF)-like protein/PAS domain S-box-containing protein